MNSHSTLPKKSIARWLVSSLTALVLFFSLAARADEQRYLLVFETTSAMKNRLPAVDAEIKTLFTTAFGGNIKSGDSVGVWTFDGKLHAGEFPLMTWEPKVAPEMASNLTSFVHGRLYSGSANFSALQPTLNRVIASSERLTVVLVCSGTGEINWTPYNDAINETIRQTRDERKKSHRPVVIVLRTQQGKYIGSTVNFPPVPANFTPFPLLPRELIVVPTNPPVVVKPTVKPLVIPPLIIVGTKHTTPETSEASKPAALPVALVVNPPVSNLVPVVVPPITPPPVKSNIETAMPVVIPANSNPPTPKPAPVVAPVSPPVPAATAAPAPAVAPKPAATSAPAALAPVTPAVTKVEDKATPVLIFIGAGFLVVAIALVVFLFTRARRKPHGSLITSSMQDDLRPPDRK